MFRRRFKEVVLVDEIFHLVRIDRVDINADLASKLTRCTPRPRRLLPRHTLNPPNHLVRSRVPPLYSPRRLIQQPVNNPAIKEGRREETPTL